MAVISFIVQAQYFIIAHPLFGKPVANLIHLSIFYVDLIQTLMLA